MIRIYKKPRCGFGNMELHRVLDGVEWSYEIIPYLADIDHKKYCVRVFDESGKPEFDEYCDEWCSECDTEVVIPSFGVSFCPNCGKPIFPCSMCDTDYISCGRCPYDGTDTANYL